MPKRPLAIVEVTPERDLSPPPPRKRPRTSDGALISERLVEQSGPSGAEEISEGGLGNPRGKRTKILSWNCETPTSFLDLPAAAGASSTKRISTYFPAGPTSSKSKGTASSRPNVLRELLSRHSYPSFLCLQEVRARPTDIDWHSAIRHAASSTSAHAPDEPPSDGGPKYDAYFSLNKSLKGQRRFGVCTLVREDEATKITKAREVDWDHEGRLLILELSHRWALVNVYALNGSDYAWRDPLLENDPAAAALPTKTRNERKREFNRLLLAEVQRMRARGLRVVLIGDFNISLAPIDCYPRLRTEQPHALARKEFNEVFIPSSRCVDIFRKLYPAKKAYSWFAKAKPYRSDCARVDYALVDEQLVEQGMVAGVGYCEAPGERGGSDHGQVWLELVGMGETDVIADERKKS